MGKFRLGLVLGTLLGCVGTYWVVGRGLEAGADCGGKCGPGTLCQEGRCALAAAPEETEQTKATPSKRKRRRKKKRADHNSATDLPPFKPVNDSHVPRFNPNKTKTMDMDGSGERLSDRAVQAQLRRLEPRFNKCLEIAALHSEDELGSGDIDLMLGIASTGRVTGVNARAPSNLKVFGILPCVRKAVYAHRFPTFDGLEMGVEYSFSVR
ncbi:MAG: hypothetical protein V3V08_02400 [Nannocystaceae bacterium]